VIQAPEGGALIGVDSGSTLQSARCARIARAARPIQMKRERLQMKYRHEVE